MRSEPLSDEMRARIVAGEFRFDRWRAYVEGSRPGPLLTPRWHRLIPHPECVRMLTSPARFKIAIAGRRSGKTEWWMRDLVSDAWTPAKIGDRNFGIMAPTFNQVKGIFWKKVKGLVPRRFLKKDPNETELTLDFRSGTTLSLFGMDKPQRVEGRDFQRVLLDEYADWKEGAWEDSIYPTLQTVGREGSAVFLGRPRSRNHFWKLVNAANDPAATDWDVFHWTSEDIMSEAQIALARASIDPKTYQRNFLAEFADDGSQVYYCFDSSKHAVESIRWDPNRPLVLCFDFNRKPGVCAYVQELPYHGPRGFVSREVTAVFGEVWIPDDSNSDRVAMRILEDFSPGGKYGLPLAEVYLEGDATGGAKGSAKVKGSDWDIILARLRTRFSTVYNRTPSSNPPERVRINAMNARLLKMDGTVSMIVDPVAAPHVVEDLRQVSYDKSGLEIAKEQGGPLTHISDAIGYYVARRWPVSPPSSTGELKLM
jgi:hypothetical protein